jgi:hypothetical protein
MELKWFSGCQWPYRNCFSLVMDSTETICSELWPQVNRGQRFQGVTGTAEIWYWFVYICETETIFKMAWRLDSCHNGPYRVGKVYSWAYLKISNNFSLQCEFSCALKYFFFRCRRCIRNPAPGHMGYAYIVIAVRSEHWLPVGSGLQDQQQLWERPAL